MKEIILFLFLHIFYLTLAKKVLEKTSIPENTELIINLIASPNYYPEYGLNEDHKDPFGNSFENSYFNYTGGQLTAKGLEQLDMLSKKVFKDIIKIKGFSNIGQIVNFGVRLKRHVDSMEIFSQKLIKEFNDNLKTTLDNNIFVNRKRIENYEIKNNFKTSMLNEITLNQCFNIYNEFTIFNYVIESSLEKYEFGLNNDIKNCPNIYKYYSDNKVKVKQFFNENLDEIKRVLIELVLFNKFVLYSDETKEAILNFSNDKIMNNFDTLIILYEYLKHNEMHQIKLQHYPKFQHFMDSLLLYSAYNIHDIKKIENYFIKNFNEISIQQNLSGLNRMITEIISNEKNKRPNKFKVYNFFAHDYNLAGYLKMFIEDISLNKLKSIPNINDGDIISIYLNKAVISDNTHNYRVIINLNNKELFSFNTDKFLDILSQYTIKSKFEFISNIC